MHPVTASLIPHMRAATLITAGLVLSACSSVDGFMSGDKIDYKSQAAKAAPLEVPPT